MNYIYDMKVKLRSVSLYAFAEQFLKDHLPEGIDEKKLEKYYVSPGHNLDSLNSVFELFVKTAQNYQRMPNVIKFDERRDEIARILHDFNPYVVGKANAEELCEALRKEFGVTSKDGKQNSWNKWSRSIVDSARFLREFNDVEDFKSFVESFSYSAATRAALPLYLSEKISGIGFALACEALKELGYEYYPKPDVHMIDILSDLKVCEPDQLSVYEELIRIADDNGITPYKLDKVLWLICSGNYYMDDVKAPGHKKEFIEQVREHMALVYSVENRMTSDFISIYTHEPEGDDNYPREFYNRYMSERVPEFTWFSNATVYSPESDVIVERISRLKGYIDRARALGKLDVDVK